MNPKNLENYSGFINIDELDELIEIMPKPEMIWRGIPRGGVGIIYGQPKTGKSMLIENIGIHIAAGRKSFLGDLLNSKDTDVVVLASLEEANVHRFQRQLKMARSFNANEQALIKQRLYINGLMSGYYDENEEWEKLISLIEEKKPTLIILDSLSRIEPGDISKREIASEAIRKIQVLANKTNATLILVHHTTKMYDKEISQDSMYGSGIIQQEIDFAVALWKKKGDVFLTDILYRYDRISDVHLKLTRNDANIFEVLDITDDQKLIRESDGRFDNTVANEILDFMKIESENTPTIATQQILQGIEHPERTVYDGIKKLEELGKISRTSKGQYLVK